MLSGPATCTSGCTASGSGHGVAWTAAGQPEIAASVHPGPPQESETALRTIELFVSGMGCRRCVREVTARLRDVRGVETVSANAARSEVRLTGSMSIEDVLSAFEDTSYALRPLDHRRPDT